MNWDQYFIELAKTVATKSKDPSTWVGAVIVGPNLEIRSTGFNGFPRGVFDNVLAHPERYARPAKYQYTEHAERNAIYNAARMGTPLDGCTLYLNYAPQLCTDCVRAVIQSGIAEVVGPNIPFPGIGAGEHYHIDGPAKAMLIETGVLVRIVDWYQ